MTWYRSFGEEMRRRFGCKVYKLALDGGMTCPNRDGTLDTRGCIFCSGSGSGDFAAHPCGSIEDQLSLARDITGKKADGCRYIAYFQSFTNTYAPADILRELFTAAIDQPDVAALSIATRPDCLPVDVLALLSELNTVKPVWVELGLQTIHKKTAEYVRRCYPLSAFDRAVSNLKSAGIEIIVHMILGLPGETPEMMYETAEYIGHSGVNGIKLQLLHVLRGTDLAADYESGLFNVLGLEDYIAILEECIRRLPPDIIIHRMTGDGAKRDLIAPLWSADKKRVLNAIASAFRRDNVVQGERYK